GVVAYAQGDDAEAAALEADALGRIEEVGDARLAGVGDFGLALAERALGHLPRAVRLARAGLEIAVAYRDRWMVGGGARVSLVVLGEHVDPERRARLLGASDALGQATGATLGVWEPLLADPGVAALREAVERGEWGEAYREGRALPFAEVAALAL